jgi:hypothetical protein
MPKVPRSTWRATQPCRTPSVGQMRTFSGTSSSLQLSVTRSSTSWRAPISCKLFLSTQNSTAQLNDVDQQHDVCTSCSTALVLVITLVLTGSNVSSLVVASWITIGSTTQRYGDHNTCLVTHSPTDCLCFTLTYPGSDAHPSIHPSIHARVFKRAPAPPRVCQIRFLSNGVARSHAIELGR